jgi:hypothetical protein
VAQAEDEARHLGLLAVGAGLALNGGHGHWGGRGCHLSLWTEPPAALARAGRAARCLNRSMTLDVRTAHFMALFVQCPKAVDTLSAEHAK